MTWVMIIGWLAIGVFIWGVVILRKRLDRQKSRENLRTQLFLHELEKARKEK
jgi:uncharacterized membrane-anchored protein YhcB (DUF1043 family)